MAIEDLRWAEQDINFVETAAPNKVGISLPVELQDEGFHPFQGYDAEIFNEWMNRAWKSVEALQTQVDGLVAQVATGIEPAFPVGSFYINKTDDTNPATLLGFGTWVAVEGVAIAGAGTYTDSRGEQKVFSGGDVQGTYRHVVSVNEMPSHKHTVKNVDIGGISLTGADGYWGYGDRAVNTTVANLNSVDSVGGGQPHNNMQPTLFTYIWERVS